MAVSRLFVDPKPASKRSGATVGRNYLNGKEGSPALPQDIYFRTPEVNIRALYVSFEIPATTNCSYLFLHQRYNSFMSNHASGQNSWIKNVRLGMRG